MISGICSKYDFLFKNKQLFIFLIGGGIGAAINLSITYFLTEFFGILYLLSYLCGFFIGITFNFLFHRSITFKNKDKTSIRFAKSWSTSIFISIGTMALIYFFTDILLIWYILSGVISITIMSILNYSINKFWVFSHENNNNL